MMYGRGRPVKGRWVFGGIERDTHICSNRTSALLDVISEWVLLGTTNHFRFLCCYKCVEDAFRLLEISHSLTDICPVTDAHTNY
ncbi:hypothetical protein X975_23017, partial [Stegodyphus mimosarum]